MKQEETIKIVTPLTDFLRHKGWLVEKTHGNRFQSGFPDLYIAHPQFMAKWIECKVIRNGSIHFEDSQICKFAKWIAYGVKIWIIADTDLRGNGVGLNRAYDKLFRDSNCSYMLNAETRKLLL